MSDIDGYRHRCIGIVNCPSRFPIVHWRPHRLVPLYRLDQDAFAAYSFRAKQGDVLLGGGGGESPALRLAIPEAFYCYTHPGWVDFDSLDEIVKAYWPMTYAFIFGDGYYQLGWRPSESIEDWLTGHILSYLVKTYPADFGHLIGTEQLVEDGSICRLPQEEELDL